MHFTLPNAWSIFFDMNYGLHDVLEVASQGTGAVNVRNADMAMY
jgi:hypothetical protein